MWWNVLRWCEKLKSFLIEDKGWLILPRWRPQMETFSALLALCAGNSPGPVNSPHKGQWSGALMFSLFCARINDWFNREAGDLRCHRGHYDVSVMTELIPRLLMAWNARHQGIILTLTYSPILLASVYEGLTHKQLVMHRCILSTVVIVALVLKHQVISIHSAD